jgi:hypothetical protein
MRVSSKKNSESILGNGKTAKPKWNINESGKHPNKNVYDV